MTIDRGVLLGLAERVEAATGPDDADLRTLNADILRALGWCSIAGVAIRPDGHRALSIPDFVTSLDAAMSLVPEGCAVDLTIWFSKNRARVLPCHKDEHGDRWLHRGSSPHYVADAATPALALTAACLKARALIPTSPGAA